MSMKIWRDQESHPYAVLAQGRFFKVGKDARRQPVDRLMRRLDFTNGVGVARKTEKSPPASDDPGSRQTHQAALEARSLQWNGLFLLG